MSRRRRPPRSRDAQRLLVQRLLAVPLLLALGSACGGPPPRYATHTCGDGPRSVRMPLRCFDPADTLADQPDHSAGIHASLVQLALRSSGRAGEIVTGLAEEYARIDEDLRRRYTAACRVWEIPCDPSQEATYQEAAAEIRAGNEGLRDLHASVAALAGSTGRIETTNEAVRSLLQRLEVAAEELRRPRAPR